MIALLKICWIFKIPLSSISKRLSAHAIFTGVKTIPTRSSAAENRLYEREDVTSLESHTFIVNNLIRVWTRLSQRKILLGGKRLTFSAAS